MKRICLALLMAVLAMAATGTVAKAAGRRPARRRSRITRLFSLPAQSHPTMPPLPDRADYYCEPTSDPQLDACCLWDQRALDGFGGWDCEVLPAYRHWTASPVRLLVRRHPVRRAALAYISSPGLYLQHIGRCRRVRGHKHENVCRASFIDGVDFFDNGQPAPADVKTPIYVKRTAHGFDCSFDPPLAFPWENCYSPPDG